MIIKMTFFNILLTILILSLNLYPTYILNKRQQKGRTYSLIHNNVQDYYFYQSLMNEGANGNFLIYDPFTTEPHKESIIFSYFTLMGKLGNLLKIPHAYTYHIIRIVSSLLFLTSAFKLIHFLKIPRPNLTYIFFLFASPFFYDQKPYMYWWTGMDAVRRAAYLPHHMFGSFLLIISVIFVLRYFTSRNLKFLIIASLISPLIAFIHTPSLIILLIVLPVSGIVYFFVNLRKSKAIGNYLYLFVYWIICLLFLSLMVSQTNKGFPWDQYLLWERTLQYPLSKELIPALGILFPFALVGIIVSVMTKKFERIFVACWFLVPFLLIPFASRLGISNIRLIQGIPYLTLSILAIIGIDFLLKLITRFLPVPRSFSVVGLFAICLLFTVFSYPVVIWSVKDQIREYSPVFGNTYLDNRLTSAFEFINSNYPRKTVTVATFYPGNYLPVYTHTISFIGHTGYTNNVSRKESEVNNFFASNIKPEEAKKFLMDNKITLVFQGPEEKQLFKGHLYPGILKPVYDRQEATIYELR